MDATTQTRPRFFYLSHPRTASNLVMRMLSFQPKLRQGEYYFVGKMSMLVENDESMATDEIQREEWLPKYQKGFDLFQDFVHSFDRGDGSLNRIENVSQSERPASGVNIPSVYMNCILWITDIS